MSLRRTGSVEVCGPCRETAPVAFAVFESSDFGTCEFCKQSVVTVFAVGCEKGLVAIEAEVRLEGVTHGL